MKIFSKDQTILATLVSAGLMSGVASAVNTNFDNGAGGNAWETVGNWSAVFPGSGDQAFINEDATLQTTQTTRRILIAANRTLTINDGGNLTGTGSVPLISDSGALVINDGGAYNYTGSFDLRAGTASATVNNGGTFNLGRLRSSASGALTISGSNADVTISNIVTVNGNSSTFVSNNSTLTLNAATLTVSDRMQWDGASVFNVGADSTLSLGNGGAGHIFTDGLTIASGGTLGTGDNSATTANFADGGAITLSDGAIIDYSINGNLNGGTGDLFDFVGTSQLVLDANHTYDLIVDVVAGDVKQTAGPFEIFAGNWIVNNGSLSSSMFNITAGDGTRLSSAGTVELGIDAQAGSIVLSGFEAFSIPEPSTAMLLGMGALVMILRRRALR